jgi:hypothetical protein
VYSDVLYINKSKTIKDVIVPSATEIDIFSTVLEFLENLTTRLPIIKNNPNKNVINNPIISLLFQNCN